MSSAWSGEVGRARLWSPSLPMSFLFRPLFRARPLQQTHRLMSTAPTKHIFVVWAPDHEDAFEKRMSVRGDHVKAAKEEKNLREHALHHITGMGESDTLCL